MSGKLWVRFLCFESVHREVASERPLLAAPQRYLRRQGARTRLIREDPHHPRPPLHLPKEPLQHVRRAYPGVVRSWVGKVGKGVPYARLEDRDGLREAPTVKLYKLLGQSPRRLLAPHLEDRFEVLRHLGHRRGRHVGQDVALKMYGAPLPLGTRQLAEDRSLYTLMVVRDHQLHATQPPVQ